MGGSSRGEGGYVLRDEQMVSVKSTQSVGHIALEEAMQWPLSSQASLSADDLQLAMPRFMSWLQDVVIGKHQPRLHWLPV